LERSLEKLIQATLKKAKNRRCAAKSASAVVNAKSAVFSAWPTKLYSGEDRGVSREQVKVVLGLIFRMALGGEVEILELSVSSAKKGVILRGTARRRD
ncbi:6797_t:CDS:2, partial [Gigaspora rosea]